MKKSVLKELASTAIYILVVLGITWLLIHYVGQRTDVEGSSMEPTLSNENSLWVDKLSYRFKDPQRFDIIVFPYKYKEDTFYIKRIIGMPGETVYIAEDGSIYINDLKLVESYGLEVIASDNRGRAQEKITLGEDEYFVLGDNRNNSVDSRFDVVGNIKRSEIIGRAVFRFFPFSKFGLIKS